ncbi:Sensor histidine kinase YycG [uncultured Ruminococcus sp.]|nr:Sensor histidine kinase YycG [uncultured Ruminococcus sp.]
MNKTPSHTGSTLRLKILAIYIIFGFLAIFTTSILVSGYALDKLTDYTASRLYKSANVTASQYLPKYFNETISLSEVRTQLSGIESYTDAAVWLVDAEGNLICSKSPDDYSDAPTVIPDFDPTENVGSIWQKGDYHGCFTEDVITVIAPVTQDFTTKGYLLIHQNLDEINALQNALLQRVYIALIIIYLLSFMIFLAFELLVHRPLVEITQAATQYASGNLNYEIPIRTSDEIGYLSASLNYMSSQLRDMENYQKKFVANVSHDFRSPLTSIKGYVEAMADGTIPPEMQSKYLNIILFETERLTDLTRDLLELNAFDTQELLLNRESFDIHDVIRSTAASFEGTCTQKKISIELVLATRHLSVFADKHKIQQVLYNLIDNAIKFSDPDSIITVETTERGEKVFVSVKDNGVGIPRDSLNKIWERFYKTDSSRGKDKKGTGLGLSIVKESIQAHGENINVISTEGVGSEFTFTLPKSKDSAHWS